MVVDIRCMAITLRLYEKQNARPEAVGICHVTNCKCTIRVFRPSRDKRYLYKCRSGREYEVWARDKINAVKTLLEFGIPSVESMRVIEVASGASPQDVKPID